MLLGKGFGRIEGPSTGTLTQVLANASNMQQKVGGITFDWSTVPVLNAPLNLPDGTVVPAGRRFLRYGSFMAEITADGPNKGMYGLYDSTANDGRQNRVRGSIFFLNISVDFEDDKSGYPAGYDGGTVFKERLLLDTGAPGGMTTAQFEAAFPLVRYAR
jgi:hypothetical protein